MTSRILSRSLGCIALLFVIHSPFAAADEVRHVVEPGVVLQAPVTADALWTRIRDAASKYAAHAPIPRIALFDVTYPANRVEYDELAGFGVLLVTVLTQDATEIPVPRVYLDGAAVTHDFRLLSSLRSPVTEASIVRVFGRHRFDGLYAFPMHLRRVTADLKIDFAIRRTGFVLARFPLSAQLDLPTTPPVAPAPPDDALLRLLTRELPDFVSDARGR